MRISIGVNENVVLSKAEKNDQGTLIVGFEEYGEVNPLEALNLSGSTQLEKASRNITVWPIKKTSFNDVPLTDQDMLDKIAEVKDTLDHILRAHLPTSQISWDIFKGTTVKFENNNLTGVVDSIDKIYANIIAQFIKMATPVLGKTPVRLLLKRQSAAKNFPEFRKPTHGKKKDGTRFVISLESQPFIEPMTVPKAASKIKFSKYEIEKGLDKWEAAGGTQEVSVAEAKEAEELFS